MTETTGKSPGKKGRGKPRRRAGRGKAAKPKAAASGAKRRARRPRLPGDLAPEQRVERMIRVDHAGEYGAVRIYAGQLAVLRRSPSAPVVEHMYDQEVHHKETFEDLIVKRRVRPTALLPFWHVAGFVLGAGTAFLGDRAAMACTVAVEEVIDAHYAKQIAELEDDESDLKEIFERFRQEELEHRDTGLKHGAEWAPAYPVLTGLIKAGSRLAIWLSERI